MTADRIRWEHIKVFASVIEMFLKPLKTSHAQKNSTENSK